jgi:hypothetical protein
LQYACTFPLDPPVDCPALGDVAAGETAVCDCTYYGTASYQNPLCNGLQQIGGKAYPSIRQLQVLRDLGRNSIVASICPKEVSNQAALDFGYRPAMTAIATRLALELAR